jgi:hypothetical protein
MTPDDNSASSNVPTSEQTRPDCVLIDDDFLVHLTWKTSAHQRHKTILMFEHPEAFFAAASGIDRNTPIYVDVNFPNGVRGEEVARNVHEAGFDHVYLATGYSPEEVGSFPWVTAVVGKNPPF